MKAKVETKPHLPRLGWLKNGNPPGDFTKALRCGAKTRKGNPCPQPAMRNGRCRLHGGKSTGPRTPEGLESMRQARTKHGLYTAEATAHRKMVNMMLRAARKHLKHLAEVTG